MAQRRGSLKLPKTCCPGGWACARWVARKGCQGSGRVHGVRAPRSDTRRRGAESLSGGQGQEPRLSQTQTTT
eukprot:6116988-Prymnesium_polylepis.2